MAIKQFPGDYDDISSEASKILAAKNDGTVGYLTMSFFDNMLSNKANKNGSNASGTWDINISGSASKLSGIDVDLSSYGGDPYWFAGLDGNENTIKPFSINQTKNILGVNNNSTLNNNINGKWMNQEYSEDYLGIPYEYVMGYIGAVDQWQKVPLEDFKIGLQMSLDDVTQIGNTAYTDMYISKNVPALRLHGTQSGGKNYALVSGIVGVSNTGFAINNVTDSRNELAISGVGNIGLGTGEPIEKLDVNGNINSKGNRIGFNTTDVFVYDGVQRPHYGLGYGLGGSGVAYNTLSGYYGLKFFTTGLERVSISNSGQFEVFGGSNFKSIYNLGELYNEGQLTLDGPAYLFGSFYSEGSIEIEGSIRAYGGFNATGNQIINVANGVNANDAVNKSQLDLKESLSNKAVDFSVMNNTKYPTTQAVQYKLFEYGKRNSFNYWGLIDDFEPISYPTNQFSNGLIVGHDVDFGVNGFIMFVEDGSFNRVKLEATPGTTYDVKFRLPLKEISGTYILATTTELALKQDKIANIGFAYYNGTSLQAVSATLNDMVLGNGATTSINPRIRSAVLSTVTPVNSVVETGDRIDVAFNKIQGQLNDKATILDATVKLVVRPSGLGTNVSMGACGMYSKAYIQTDEEDGTKLLLPSNPKVNQIVDIICVAGSPSPEWEFSRVFASNGTTQVGDYEWGSWSPSQDKIITVMWNGTIWTKPPHPAE